MLPIPSRVACREDKRLGPILGPLIGIVEFGGVPDDLASLATLFHQLMGKIGLEVPRA